MEDQLLAVFAPLAGYTDAAGFIDTLKGEDGELSVSTEEAAKKLAAEIRAKSKSGRDDQYKRGQKEMDRKVKQAIAERFGKYTDDVDADNALGFLDAVGERVISDLNKPQKKSEGDPKPFEITPDFLASNEVAKTYFNKEYNRKLEADRQKLREAQEVIERERQEFRRTNVSNALRIAAEERAKELGVLLEVEGVKTGSRLSAMLDRGQFSPDKFKVEDGIPVPVDADGNRLEDEMGNYITLDDIIKQTGGATYGYATLDQKKATPGLKTSPRRSNGKVPQFTDEEDFGRQYQAAPNKKAKVELKEAWEAQHPVN